MCGIVGFSGPPAPELLRRMNAAQAHRGPDEDDAVHFADAEMSLAMCRLSIVDLAGGHQPMAGPDGLVWVVFNGEIFNAGRLRAELARDGAAFRTDHSDTEVLLQAYLRWGDGMVERLEGMFAFAILDRRQQRVLLAVDRFSIKPLYVSLAGRRLSFASELKSLLELSWIGRELDSQSLFHFLSLQSVPAPSTILRDVRRLEPAQTMTYDLRSGRTEIARYWRPAPLAQPSTNDPVEAAALVRERLEAAVRDWSIADVPVACSLSGGFDSSIVTGLLATSGAAVSTYTLGFDDMPAIDERRLARAVARRWGTQHHEVVLSAATLLADLDAMIVHLDEPYAGGLPSWFIFKAMHGSVKVAMTGVGGDEVFGVYGKWRAWMPWMLRHPRALPTNLRRSLSRWPDGARYHPMYLRDAEKRAIVVPDVAEAATASEALLQERWDAAAGRDVRDRAACLDLWQQLPNEFLPMTDRFSMAHSIEARTPFLDHRLVECALGLPARVRTDPIRLKKVLVDATADLIPEPVRTAPKQGFVIPAGDWLRGELRDDVTRLLQPSALRVQGLFQPEAWTRYVQPHLDGAADHSMPVWTLYMFQRWHERFLAAR